MKRFGNENTGDYIKKLLKSMACFLAILGMQVLCVKMTKHNEIPAVVGIILAAILCFFMYRCACEAERYTYEAIATDNDKMFRELRTTRDAIQDTIAKCMKYALLVIMVIGMARAFLVL